MAIALVASTHRPNSSGSNPYPTPNINTSAANFILTASSLDGGPSPATDSLGSTLTQLTIAYEVTTPVSAQLAYAHGASLNVGATHNARVPLFYGGLAFLAFSGVATSSPIGGQNQASGNGVTSLAAGSVTPPAGGCMCVAAISFDTAGYSGLTIGGGFTIIETAGDASLQPIVVATKLKSAGDATAENPTWSWTGSAKAAAKLVVINAPAAAPVLSSPTGTATGPTQATIGVTSDTAPTTTAISYQILPSATAAPDAATIVGAPTGTITTGSAGALTKAITGLTTDTAVKVHFAQGASSNVVSSAAFTPSTLAWTGTYPAQSGVAGSAFTHSGTVPTPTGGIGSKSYSATGLGASGLTMSSSTGQLQGTCGTAGVYNVTPTVTDQSTVPAAQSVSLAAFTLTISAPAAGPTIDTQPTNQTAKVGATATFTVAATSSGGALSYQWRKDGTPISGATSATYARTGVVLGDHGGVFTCAVTDSNGTTVSSGATLTVAVTFAGTVPSQSGATGATLTIDLSSYFSGGLSRTFAVLSGSMPTGLSQVGTTAVWTGTLGAAGSGSFVVRSTDSAANTDDTNTVAWVIGATTPGTITSAPLANNSRVLLPSKALTWIGFRDYATGNPVLVKTGVTTDSSAQFSVTDVALTPGNRYLIDWLTADGEHGRAEAYAV